jgi:hypothetical protein
MMKWTGTALLALAAVAALAFTTHADSGNPPDTIVQISGSFNFQQEFIANPVPDIVTEQFNVSYELDETTDTLVPGSMSFTDSGTFGPLSLSSFSSGTVDWSDAAGDVVQVTFYEDFNPQPLPGDIGGFFISQANPSESTFPGGHVNVSAVPEPSSFALLGIGVLGLLAFKRAH